MNRTIAGSAISLVTLLATVFLWSGTTAAQGQFALGETWAQEGYSLEARESFQFAVGYGEIPVRRWELVVDGGGLNCDVSVLRVLGEELLYYETKESRHEIPIPWGLGEEIMVVITNRDHSGVFEVSLEGPPKDDLQVAYSYDVNRALENFAAGKNIKAEEDCLKALKVDPDDLVAKVLLAGFLRDKQFYGQAEALISDALAGDLSGYMRDLAENLRSELIILQAPLPEFVLRGVRRAQQLLDDGKGQEALKVCDGVLDGKSDLDGPSRGKFLTLKGRSLELLGRNFPALDAYTQALNYTRSKDGKAVVYFYMGHLFQQMDNLAQAQGAFAIALEYGLPSGLELQARESLQDIGGELKGSH